MPNVADFKTDALLEKIERKVRRTYNRAEYESKKKLLEYLRQFGKQDKEARAAVRAGKMTKEAYLKWRKEKMLGKKRFQEILNTLSADCANADKIAMSIVRGYIPDAYTINRNFAAFEIEKGSLVDTSFTLYDRQTVERIIRERPDLLPHVDVPKDLQWNRGKIRAEITQAILQGESIPHVADRLTRVIGMDKAAAIRNARTAITGAQNAGRVDSYKRAEEMGIGIKQEWMATLDSRTRHSHAVLDGEKVNVGEKFSNGCRYPGDPQGPPSEIYNCRCTLVAFLTGLDLPDVPRRSALGSMTYEDWKNAHKEAFKKEREG